MIEVEKKFILKPGDEERLTGGAVFIKRTIMRDIYYDTPDWKLTTKNWWLRDRDGRWELKLPTPTLHALQDHYPQYEEIETEQEIARRIRLPRRQTFRQDLTAAGYAPVADITTTRRKYRRDRFVIDLDLTDTDFAICEIELMVEKPEEVPTALQRIIEFAQQFNLDVRSVRGKVLAAIKQTNLAHYQALIEAGVVWETDQPPATNRWSKPQ